MNTWNATDPVVRLLDVSQPFLAFRDAQRGDGHPQRPELRAFGEAARTSKTIGRPATARQAAGNSGLLSLPCMVTIPSDLRSVADAGSAGRYTMAAQHQR